VLNAIRSGCTVWRRLKACNCPVSWEARAAATASRDELDEFSDERVARETLVR
jgi:hypothetical protein